MFSDAKNKITINNRLELKDYRKLKPKVVELSYYLEMDQKVHLPRKRLNKEVKNILHEFDVSENLKPVFISNLLIPDEESLLKKIDEAIHFGCRMEDVPSYISINYQIPKDIIELKFKEIKIYKQYYQKTKQEEIEKVFHKVA